VVLLIESEPEALDSCFDAFSSREPVSTSLESRSGSRTMNRKGAQGFGPAADTQARRFEPADFRFGFGAASCWLWLSS